VVEPELLQVRHVCKRPVLDLHNTSTPWLELALGFDIMTSGSIHAEGRYLCRLCGDSSSIFLLNYGQTKKPTKPTKSQPPHLPSADREPHAIQSAFVARSNLRYINALNNKAYLSSVVYCVQCFDTVGWATERASGL